MKQLGTHLVMDAWQCPSDLLNSPEHIRRAILDAINAGEATLIDFCIHQFSPHGVTATATLAESHIAIHTWPEFGYFAADAFFCGKGNPRRAIELLAQSLQAQATQIQEFRRGFELEAEPSHLSDVKGFNSPQPASVASLKR
ncbi:MAG: adenosylmethionine decarboxylase [Microcoleaceae cyanobacterium]